MILFLHGGGNGGYEGERDNEKQLMADYGPVNFAEEYPDVYVMAPMCVEQRRDLSKANMNIKFADSNFSFRLALRLVSLLSCQGLRHYPQNDPRRQG